MKKIFTILSIILLSSSAYAELAYNSALSQSDFNNNSTVVKKEGTIEWDSDHIRCGGSSNGIGIGGPSWNWDDKYFDVKLANGVPNKLTFEWACNNITSTYADWYVQESANGSTWTDVWTNTSSSTSWTSVSKDLKATTRYLRFCFSGNFAGNYRNIKVTEKILMGTPNPETLDFGTVKVDDQAEQTFTLGWTNLTGTATSSDSHFSVTPDAFGEIGANLQNTTFTVTMSTAEAGVYSGTITLEGRNKSAQVAVSGTVEKYNQSINWEPAETVNYGATLAQATATSGLDVTYEISNPAVVKYENGVLTAIYAGTTTVTAKQAGNYKYNAAADVVKTITVVAPTTYGDFQQSSCDEAVVFNNQSYEESFAGDVPVGKNYMGGDSIVHVLITINHPTFGSDEKTIVYGAEESWNGIALKDSTVGVHYVVYQTTNVAGCDSTVTLTLTVTKQNAIEVPVALSFCEGDQVAYRDMIYTEAGTDEILVEGETVDTVYQVTVTVNYPYYSDAELTKTVGEAVLFEEDGWLLRGETPVEGVYMTTKADTADLWFIHYGQTVLGCDSVERLNIKVELLDPVETEKELEMCEGEQVEYRGVQYSIAGEYPVLVEDAVRDTLINVIVTVHEKAYAEIERTVLAGEVLTLPEGEWTIGDQIVSGNFETQRGDTLGLEFYQYDETEFGCESVVKLIVTVTPNYEAVENVEAVEKAEKFFRNGVLYIRRGDRLFTTDGREAE